MSEGTLAPSVDVVGTSVFDVEYTVTIDASARRRAIKFSDFPRVTIMRNLFASVVLSNVVVEVRQNAFVGESDGDVIPGGHIYLAIIPTSRDTDASSGSTAAIINNVPNKQTFPLSSNSQANETFRFNLSGYETDLAQDPRRGAGPVAWVGNSGVTAVDNTAMAIICTATWRATLTCSGATPLWQ